MPQNSRTFAIVLLIANQKWRGMVTAGEQPAQPAWTADFFKVKEPR
jgi:hypothetical protein